MKGSSAKARKKRHLVESLRTALPVAALVIVSLYVAYQFVGPAPSLRLTIATGSESGAYHRFAERYRQFFARHGVLLELHSTAGSEENLRLLRAEEGVELAFAQSGLDGGSREGILSLASLYYEPLWVFYRGDASIAMLRDLAGKRLAVGEEGSGSRNLVLKLLAANGIDANSAILLAAGGRDAARGLFEGRVDAVFFVASPESPLIVEMLEADGVRLMPIARAEAYARRYRFLSQLVLPEGAADLQRDIPASDVPLVAAAATLLCREDLHSALIDLAMQAVADEHGGGGVFEEPDEFPSRRYLFFPLSSDADRYFKSGPPFLQRFLPFWAATLIDRLKFMMVPLLVLFIPLFKVFPPVYRWRVRARVYRWYRELQEFDARLYGERALEDADELDAELERIEREVARVSVPLAYGEELYNLRLHVALIRGRVRELKGG